MSRYKILFFGTPKLAVPSLVALLTDPRFEVVHIISQPDKPVGREQKIEPTPVKEIALKYNINITQPEKLNIPENIELFKSLQPDFIVVVAFGKIISKSILDIPKYGCINVHSSILPKYRGASPVQFALRSGEKETGVTIMLMDEKMDEGDILYIEKIPITHESTSETLFQELYKLGAKLLLEILVKYANKEISPTPQDHTKATYTTKITKEMGEINLVNETAEEIYHKWQAYTPWPKIFTIINNKRIIFHEIDFDNGKFLSPNNIEITDKNELYWGTKSGSLIIKQIQVEGKNKIDAKAFVTGYIRDNKIVL